jgi:hypothetical protein
MRKLFLLSIAITLCLINISAVAISSNTPRYLEVIGIEIVQSPSVGLAISSSEVSRIDAEITTLETHIRTTEKALDEAERHERAAHTRELVQARRDLRRLESIRQRQFRDALAGNKELVLVHCWDGFAKSPVVLWIIEDLRLLRQFQAGSIISCNPKQMRLRSIAIGNEWSPIAVPLKPDSVVNGYTVDEVETVRSEPVGFLRFSHVAEPMPWDTYPATNVNDIRVHVLESSDPSQTMLLINFVPPRDRQLASIVYRVYPLDEHGNPQSAITGDAAVREVSLGKSKDGAISTFLDPGRRFAFGFSVVIEDAHYSTP